MIIGKRLCKNDTIGIVAPASFATDEQITAATKVLEAMGYRVILGNSCHHRWYSYAGTDQIRVNDLHEFFQNPEIDAIICLRGGYGSIRILDKIDYDLIKSHPKIFVGYSDITLLHTAFNQLAGLITFHGPMLASNMTSDLDPVSQKSFQKSLSSSYEPFIIENPENVPLKTLFNGKAAGILTGGNLITLLSTMGTPFEPNLKGKILFIEEVSEPTYRIDRALTQLMLSGKLAGVQGIILGDFKDCQPATPEDTPLMEVFRDRLGHLGIPVVYNLQTGHCAPKITLPLGVLARIDTNQPQIEILEKVVE